MTASARRSVSVSVPRWHSPPVMASATARATEDGTWEPPGPSKCGDPGGQGREPGADAVHVVRAGHQTNALSPVIARPTIRVFTSRVPS